MQARCSGVGTLAAIVACAASQARAVEITALPPPSGNGVERGVAVLRCAVPGDLYWESRAAVLDVGATAHADVLLTTRHGLPEGPKAVARHCRVIARGKPYSVVAVWRTRTGALEQDWAVLLTERLGDDIRRLRPSRVTPEALGRLVTSRAPVRLVLRYAGEEQSDCNLEPSTLTHAPLVTTSCLGYHGLSGTPIVARVELEPVVIAIHVGTQLELDGTRLERVSIARVLDADIAAAIEAAAARARTTQERGRTRR